MTVLRVFLLAALVLPFPAIADDEEWTPFTTEEFKKLVVGNTIKGSGNQGLWTEYYFPNGKINGTWEGAPYSAKWKEPEDDTCPTVLYRNKWTKKWKCYKLFRNAENKLKVFISEDLPVELISTSTDSDDSSRKAAE